MQVGINRRRSGAKYRLRHNLKPISEGKGPVFLSVCDVLGSAIRHLLLLLSLLQHDANDTLGLPKWERLVWSLPHKQKKHCVSSSRSAVSLLTSRPHRIIGL